MRDTVSYWRRVAGLYLSAAPVAPDDSLDSGASQGQANADGSALPEEGNRQQLYLLCEALDLVISAQGYNAPAVPPLLHALIGTVRLLRVAPGAAAAKAPVEKSASEAAEKDTTAERPEAQKPAVEEMTEEAAAEPGPEESASAVAGNLDRRLTATEHKLAALTDAVGRLVEHLERRQWTVSPVERRAEPRLPGVDAAIYIDRQRYRVIDWNTSGFCIQVGESELLGRRRFAFRFTLELLDETIEFQGHATPMRREGRRLAARFVQLDPAVEVKLTEVVRRLSGATA